MRRIIFNRPNGSLSSTTGVCEKRSFHVLSDSARGTQPRSPVPEHNYANDSTRERLRRPRIHSRCSRALLARITKPFRFRLSEQCVTGIVQTCPIHKSENTPLSVVTHIVHEKVDRLLRITAITVSHSNERSQVLLTKDRGNIQNPKLAIAFKRQRDAGTSGTYVQTT